MKRQRPTDPVWLHERHGPLQATLQQTPSAQCPEAQSLSSAQSKLLSFKPQLRAVHCCPAEHSSLVVQLLWQRLLPGLHE
jgi:hypothetical protein